ncbi:MAG: signal recognition particle-docking protein FtsY [Gammaproteobacteria bacterium]|nr:signal recognition particle-docking protein FtsY [Gammaproteobacteria bacterium]
MFDFLKRKKTTENPPSAIAEVSQAPEKEAPKSFFNRLKQGLSKTRHGLTDRIGSIFLGKKLLDRDVLNEIETLLLSADVGVETTTLLIDSLTQQLARKELNDTEAALHSLKAEMKNILRPRVQALPTFTAKPFVMLMVGINGSGKTTTIGKLAHYFLADHKTVMLAAGDTFRAAAIEQLQTWGERNHVPVIAQLQGADTAAVIFDAFAAAKARNTDLLLADTAGRLHTQSNLMAELQKIKRVLAKTDPSAPHEVLIVIDATLGQNALNQVKQFHAAIGLTGIVITKLDGTAKGGIIFAIAKEFDIPIRFIGVGEGMDDLRPFQADEFVDALFSS